MIAPKATNPFQRLKRATAWRALPLWLALACSAGGAYLLVARLGYGVAGFPLDDAWIHQTYARNLVASGDWAFVPGQTSAGSTSPLWSLLLSLGYWLGLPYRAWTYALGIAALGLTGWTLARLGARLFPDRPWLGPLAGLFCVLEWHLIWASVSGMETMLYTWLSVWLVETWVSGERGPATDDHPPSPISQPPAFFHWAALGLLGGLLALTRPEGLGLVGLIGLAVGWRLWRTPGRLARAWVAMGIGLALPLTPYLAFHYATTGLPFPNTFYAKQEEYRVLLSLHPIWRRWLAVAAVTLVGAQVLLLPGFVYGLWLAISNLKSANLESGNQGIGQSRIRDKRPTSWPRSASNPSIQPSSPLPLASGLLLIATWWFAHLTLYALRLPVTYQHGRYQIPVIPFFLLVGLGGMSYLLRPSAPAMLLRAASRALIVATALVALAFLGLGARAYAADVAFIQGEMVATARWLAGNVPPDSLIAVHDIGAIGYFTPRPLLDLAGLVTPEVIPIMTDEEQLIQFMQKRGADYVVFFADWSEAYRRMAQDPRLERVYATGFDWTERQGRANMAVYRLRSYPK